MDSYPLSKPQQSIWNMEQYFGGSVANVTGLAYEHELDGKARATTYGYSIDSPKLTGGTGIGELGFSLKPSKDLPLYFDLGVQGYVGKRERVTGSLQVRFEF